MHYKEMYTMLTKEEKLGIILYKFNRKRRELDKIPNINRGGCGIVAYAMSKWLKKHDVEHSVLFCDWSTLIRWNVQRKDPTSCSHVVIQINDYIFDTDERIHIDDFRFEEESRVEITCDEYLKRCLNIREWNRDFKRQKNITTIENILNVSLDEVDKDLFKGFKM